MRKPVHKAVSTAGAPSGAPAGSTCAVCASPLSSRPSATIFSARLFPCGTCGSWTYFPRPSPEEQAAVHDHAEYFDHPYFELRRRATPASVQRCRYIFARLAEAIDISRLSGKRLLDIGCDTGVFLRAAAQEFGIIPVGIDVSRAAVREAASSGIEAYHARLEDAPVQLRDFPAITAIDLIEHVTEPKHFLSAVRERLAPGGAVYLETPNICSFVYIAGAAAANWSGGWPRTVFERLFPPQHIQYFTPMSLSSMAKAAGFEVVKLDTRVLPWRDTSASILVRLAMGVLQLLDRLTARRILICAVLRRSETNRRASGEL